MFNKELFGQLDNSLMVNYSMQVGYVYAEKVAGIVGMSNSKYANKVRISNMQKPNKIKQTTSKC